jgi:phosphate-selective porin OprO and OprP
VRMSLAYPLAAGLVVALAVAAAPARAISDLERLDQLEQEVALLKRKMEVQQEEATAKAATTPVVGAGPDGFFLRSPDSKFIFRLRGYAQADTRWLTDSDTAGDDTFLIRRARPVFEGTVFDVVDFRIMPDFAGSTLVLFDAYANLRYFPQAQIMAGKFKPPLGLERLQSATATMFVERGFPTYLVPNRDVGAMIWSDLAEGMFTYQIAGFNGVRDGGNNQTGDVDTDDGKDVVARFFVHPFRPLGNEWLDNFGIGFAGSYGTVDDQSPQTFKTPAASTNFFQYRGASATFAAVVGDGQRTRWSPQAYWYAGPFGFLAEYVSSQEEMQRDPLPATPGDSSREKLTNTAWGVEVSYALTGENASYKGLIPASNFSPSKGTWGAFEIAARYGEIDFDDDSFTGGAASFADPTVAVTKAQGWTVGANWYLNRYLKFMLNFDRTTFDGGDTGVGNTGNRPSEETIFTRLQFQY